MFKRSICVEMIYTEKPFLQRIERIKDLGFDAFEFWSYQNREVYLIKDIIKKTGLKLAAIIGSKTELTDPEKNKEAICDIKKSINIAQQIGCENLIILTGQNKTEINPVIQKQNIIKILKKVSVNAENAGVTLILEPLNRYDHPGYFLNSSQEGFDIINKVNSLNLKLLFDIYHQQITEGNIINNILSNIDLIGHIHVADVPGRNEPGTGELNYINILKTIVENGYDKYVGLEFNPKDSSREAIGKFNNILKQIK